ncbi:hypothetical protein O181_043225 [Austropuccinia psidii MF-1]|uniref:Uncharacterized protein n=1 Tax=Austropuccinia psidii MF-1 TaxID=1389203 RepID=A0A9Q3DM50_9BASI|nr:hypothetical protein [Austropuccinia psidii MF-1]
MHFQRPNTSHATPYTGPGSQCFTCNSLSLARFPMLHMQFLMLVQFPNTSNASSYTQCLTHASHANPYALFPTLSHVPNASKYNPYTQCFTRKYLHQKVHTQFLMLVRLIVGDIRTGNDSRISGGLLICGEPQVFYNEDLNQYIPLDAENVEGINDYYLHILCKRASHKEIIIQIFSEALKKIDLKEEMICTIEEIRQFYGNKECNKN